MAWPELPFAEWQDTYDTLHMWTQIVGKTRLALAPMENHWWQVALYVTPRGLTTSAIPYGERSFIVDFDFLDHQLKLQTSDGGTHEIPLVAQSVRDFYRTYMAALGDLGLDITVYPVPVEVETAIPFAEDRRHASYNRDIREFILPYEKVRSAATPDETLLEFLQSTYDAAANLANWDRADLDRPPTEWP
jgi:hypothetical protein